jgi:serine/threonine protein kinase
MGLSKLIDEECEDTHDSLLSTSYNSSMHPSTQQHPPGRHAPHGGWGGGTIGWSPPEIYQKRKNRQQSNRIGDSLEEVEEIEQTDQHNSYKAADIFSLGCVFHFVLVPGMHPFGNSHERLQNILNNQSNLSSLRQVSPPLGSPVGSNVLAYDLIQRMIRFTPSARPNITQILSHPYFWSFTTRLDFLNDFSDRLQFEIKSLESLLNLKHVDVLLYNLDSTSAVVVKEIRRQWSKGTGAGAGAGMGHRRGTKGKSGGGSLKENLYLRMETMRDVIYDNQSILFHPPTSSVSSSSSPSLSSGGPAAASASDTTALTEDHTNTGNDASHDLPSVNPNGGEKNKMKKNHLPWDTSLPEVLVTDLLTHGKYNFSSITDCLRMIRNKRRHRDEIPRSISSLFETDELFYSYFESLYPNLLISCLVIAVKYLPKDDPFVIKYCSKLSGIFDADEVIHLEENEIFPEESSFSHSISSSFSSEHSSAPADSSADSVSGSSSSGNSTGGSGRSRGSRSSSGAPAVSGSASGAAAGGVTNFRTRMCHSGASCPFRAKGKCTFAHSEEELIVRKKRIVK